MGQFQVTPTFTPPWIKVKGLGAFRGGKAPAEADRAEARRRGQRGGSDDQAKLQHKPGTFYTILPATYRKCPALHLQVSERALHLP